MLLRFCKVCPKLIERFSELWFIELSGAGRIFEEIPSKTLEIDGRAPGSQKHAGVSLLAFLGVTSRQRKANPKRLPGDDPLQGKKEANFE